MAAKLKNLNIKKVDFVDEGANPRANIKLYKRKEETSSESKKVGMGNRITSWIEKMAGIEQEGASNHLEQIQKNESIMFKEKMNERNRRNIMSEIWDICDALNSSFCSILKENVSTSEEIVTLMQQNVDDFTEVIRDAIKEWSQGKVMHLTKREEQLKTDFEIERLESICDGLKSKMEKAKKEQITSLKGEQEEMKLDKSKMTAAEKAFYEEIEKRYGTEGVATLETGKEPPVLKGVNESVVNITEPPKVTISAPPVLVENETEDIYKGLNPAVAAELQALKKYREEKEDQELQEIAKRYAVIGKKPEELVPLLKSLKAFEGSGYEDMIALLDATVHTIENAGIFSEIGKCGSKDGGNGETEAIAKVRVKAAELRKTRPELTDAQAMDEVLLKDAQLRAEIDQ